MERLSGVEMDALRGHPGGAYESAHLPRCKFLDCVKQEEDAWEHESWLQDPWFVPEGGACRQSTDSTQDPWFVPEGGASRQSTDSTQPWFVPEGGASRQSTDSVLEMRMSSLARHEPAARGTGSVASEHDYASSHMAPSEWLRRAADLISSRAIAAPERPKASGKLSRVLSLHPSPVVQEGQWRAEELGVGLFEDAEVADAEFTHYFSQSAETEADMDDRVCAATVSPATKLARNIAEGGGGLPPDVTTVMFRHIPRKYSERQVMREINDAGFMGKFDFFYLPMDTRSRANRGFAFLNFHSPAFAQEFYNAFHGSELRNHSAEKELVVLPADFQGFDCNAAHYLSSRPPRSRLAGQSRPLFFKTVPSHLRTGLVQQSRGAAAPQTRSGAVQQKDHGKAGRPAAPPPARFCAYCGCPKEADGSFCPRCGQRWLA